MHHPIPASPLLTEIQVLEFLHDACSYNMFLPKLPCMEMQCGTPQCQSDYNGKYKRLTQTEAFVLLPITRLSET